MYKNSFFHKKTNYRSIQIFDLFVNGSFEFSQNRIRRTTSNLIIKNECLKFRLTKLLQSTVSMEQKQDREFIFQKP
ncbi:hypothetical protein LEP1GSC088_2421 [Leptospira interrogans str. L1207]|nr:hypothetical protein LEP1GSC088_2421 [Leptospira interrogans str. L1207]